MSEPLKKPDLEDSINVSETHDRLVRQAAAAARENPLAENGSQPIALWILIPLAVVLVVAGLVLGKGSGFFSYDSTFRDGYVRAKAPGEENSGPQPKPALAAYSAKGAKIYSSKCNGCHGADAKGDGANYPSLVGSKWVMGETELFSMVILNGLHGPTSTGKVYGAAGMPAQGGGMSAEDLAGIMTYLRNSLGNSKGDIVTVDMAKAALEISGKRKNAGKQVDADELKAEHAKDLPGDKLDPATLVLPGNLAPAPAK
jgi:mono/diheme cytochrome c family protein